MSASNFHGIVNGSIEPNGTAARGAARARGAKRAAPAKGIERVAKPKPELAGFVKTESQAQDAPMWPIHPVMWLQPELRLRVPGASDLRIERKHRVPSPEFVHGTMTPVDLISPRQKTIQPVLPLVARQFPTSGLTPLGWDPRVDSQLTGREDRE